MGKRHDYGADTGRLNTALAEAAQQIVYARYRDDRPDQFGAELLAISEIDRAYLVMLAEEHIADVTAVRRMLRQIDELRGSRFAAVRDRPMPRGLYLAYEFYLREVLGDEVGGIAHAGRSRNDLNAAVLRLRARELDAALVTAAARLCEELLAGASRYRDVIMPAYTHGQAAVPVTYGHYLAALACPLTRAIDNLLWRVRNWKPIRSARGRQAARPSGQRAAHDCAAWFRPARGELDRRGRLGDLHCSRYRRRRSSGSHSPVRRTILLCGRRRSLAFCMCQTISSALAR